MKNIYCTLDTETYGGAATPKGIYHLGGVIHTRAGEVLATFNLLIAEHYDEIAKDDYAKKNFDRYAEMVENGVVSFAPTEEMAVAFVDDLLKYYGAKYVMAFNSGFDFTKTKCRELLNGREFIDIQLMALQTLAGKRYADFCRDNDRLTASKKSVSTNAESFYAFITDQPDYCEEHTAFEDSKIEMLIFLACLRTHKKFTKNAHWWDYVNENDAWYLVPKV